MDNKKSFAIGFAAGIVIVLVAVFGFNAFNRQGQWAGQQLDPNSKIMEIYGLLNDISIFPLDKDVMLENMYRGFLDGVGDPYTQYFDLEALEAFHVRTEGEYVGIGVSVLEDLDSMTVTVAQPFRGSPAAAAGILPGDRIIAVDGVDVVGRAISEVTGLIRGPEGTSVDITFFRPYESERFDVTIIRTVITIPTVFHEMMPNQIGYIRIEGFDQATRGQFTRAMDDLLSQNMTGLILDVRNNPGGILDIVAYIANYFVPEGVITYTVDARGRRQDFPADANYLGIPLVLLVNGRSASASELLGGAIQDTRVGILVGEQTFGKGIVQHVRYLSDGTAIKATVAQYFTPNGRSIHGVGVTPDLIVEMPESLSRMIGNMDIEEDVQLQAALRVFNRD